MRVYEYGVVEHSHACTKHKEHTYLGPNSSRGVERLCKIDRLALSQRLKKSFVGASAKKLQGSTRLKKRIG